MTPRRSLGALAAVGLGLPARKTALAAPAASSGPSPPETARMMMLTLVRRHDESQTLPQIAGHLKATGWLRDVPPPGVEIVSRYVMMVLGQVVTLRFDPSDLRRINPLVEGEAWGAFRTEFHPTYDHRAPFLELRAKAG